MSIQYVSTFEMNPQLNNVIAQLQTNGAGQPLVFNTPNTDYVMPGNLARRISLTSTVSLGAAVFTIIGINLFGNRVTENITSVSTNPRVSSSLYRTIERIINVNGAGPVQVGLALNANGAFYANDFNRINGQFNAIQIQVSGTGVTYDVRGGTLPFQTIRSGNLAGTGQSAVITSDILQTENIAGLSGSTSTLVQLTQYYSIIRIAFNATSFNANGVITATIVQPGLE